MYRVHRRATSEDTCKTLCTNASHHDSQGHSNSIIPNSLLPGLSFSFSSVLRFFSFSLIARSYSRSSSVRFGALTPSAPAISLPATAVVFSGRLSGFPALTPLSPRVRLAPKGVLSGKSKGVGEAGVGGGGCGGSVVSSCAVDVVLMGAGAVLSVSVSDPEDSRSQLSATGLDFGLCSGFCGTVVLSLRCESVVAISG
jgi:hypothetical protein